MVADGGGLKAGEHKPVLAQHRKWLSNMRKWSFGLAVSGLFVILVSLLTLCSPASVRPLVVRVVSTEKAGVFDDSGTEMHLLTLAVSNENPEKHHNYRDAVYLADSARGVEVKVKGSWRKLEWATNLWGFDSSLLPGKKNERGLVLVPGGEGCRVWLRYDVPSLSGKGVLELLVTQLPLSIRSRLSYKFWRWVGFPGIYRPGHWREICVELAPSPPSN